MPIDDTGLELRPLFAGEVVYVSANPRRSLRPVSIATLAERPFILYESSASIADPTRLQLAARAQAAGVQLAPRIEVESADTALERAVLGLGDTYAPQILRGSRRPVGNRHRAVLTGATGGPALAPGWKQLARSEDQEVSA